MKTGILTDPYGNPIGGSGGLAAPAIDANHIYVYDCSETSGSTLANTGSGSNGTLTFNGTENTDYTMGESFLGKTLTSFRNLNYNSTGGAKSGTSCSISGGEISIEILLATDYYTSGFDDGKIIEADAGVNDFIRMSAYFGNIRLEVGTNGHATGDIYFNSGLLLQCPLHLLGTYSSITGAMKIYANGLTVITGSTVAPYTMPTLTRVGVGDSSESSGQSFKGYMTQARFSNVVRSASYALATAENFLGM